MGFSDINNGTIIAWKATMTTKSLNKRSIISNPDEAKSLQLDSCDFRKIPNAILMCKPTYFEVKDVKNPFMKGHLEGVDKELATKQWQDLKEKLEKTEIKVSTISGVKNLEDMVFTANQVLVGVSNEGTKYVLPGRMKHESRRLEVPHYIRWFKNNGYEVKDSLADQTNHLFEGHGDAIWHPETMLLWGGYGHRTSKESYYHISAQTNVPIILLELVDSTYYHLDTCFCTLDKETVMIYPKAFSQTGLELISSYFKTVLEVEPEEASNFACNALAIGKNIFIQKNNPKICQKVNQLGFNSIEVDTSEFMKSGGSVFCLTLDFYI